MGDFNILYLNDADIFYLTKFKASNQALLQINDKLIYFTDSRYYFDAYQKLLKLNISVVNISGSALLDAVINCIKENNYDIFCDETITKAKFDYLKFNLSNRNLKVLSNNPISDKRRIKSKDEINKIVNRVNIAKKSFNSMVNYIKEGISEIELKAYLEYQFILNGAEDKSFDSIIAFSENAAIPHAKSSRERKLQLGDIILCDFGVLADGYMSDTTRMISFGKPTSEFVKDYKFVLDLNERFIDLAVEGAKCESLNRKYANLVIDNIGDYALKHSLGHGVGVEIHERPFLSGGSKDILMPGDVVTIEPGIYKKDYGIRIEDMILIGNCAKNKNTILTKIMEKNLIIL